MCVFGIAQFKPVYNTSFGSKVKGYQNSVRTTKFHHQLVLWTSDFSIPVSTPDAANDDVTVDPLG